MLRILVIALVALVAALFLLPRPGDMPRGLLAATVLDAPRDLPATALTDSAGNAFSVSDLSGRMTLAFFGFTNCPDICPLTLDQIARSVATLRADYPDRVPQVLFVSVDPARDSPERIRAYLDGFDETFIGVTADDETLAPLLDALAVSVHKQVVDGEQYNVVHNGTIYILDDDARWIALLGGSSHESATIVNDYLAGRLETGDNVCDH